MATKFQKFREHKKHIFDLLDSDNDGVVCMADLMVFPNNFLAKGKVEDGARLSELYKEYYVRVCLAAGYRVEQPTLAREDWIRGAIELINTDWYQKQFLPGILDVYFSALDLNHDGKLCIKEWELFYKSRRIEDKEYCARTFQKMDTNGDGFISPEEFKHGFIQMAIGNDTTQDFSFLYPRKQ